MGSNTKGSPTMGSAAMDSTMGSSTTGSPTTGSAAMDPTMGSGVETPELLTAPRVKAKRLFSTRKPG